jgi:hypothetical protein
VSTAAFSCGSGQVQAVRQRRQVLQTVEVLAGNRVPRAMKHDLRMEVFQEFSNPGVVIEVGLDKRRLRFDSAQPPGFPARPNQGVHAMTIPNESPDELRPDPSRRARDERRGAFALSDA